MPLHKGQVGLEPSTSPSMEAGARDLLAPMPGPMQTFSTYKDTSLEILGGFS